MPPVPAVAFATRVITTIQMDNGDIAENVIHFLSSVEHPDETQVRAVMDLVHSEWAAHLKTYCPITAKLVRIRGVDMTYTPYSTFITDYSEDGTGAGNQMPAQLSGVVSLHTGVFGRSGRGRIYVGPLNSAALDSGGKVSSAFKTAALAFGSSLVTGTVSGGGTFTLGVYSRKYGSVNQVEYCSMDNRIDVQRRRANRTPF